MTGLEHAREGLEHAHEAAEGHSSHNDRTVRRVAVLISALAAALAIAETEGKSTQNEYLTHHISTSDDWAFYQAKTQRSAMFGLHAEMLESLPNAADPEVRKRIDAARAEKTRLDDDEKTKGRKQLQEQALAQTKERDEAGHRYHVYEIVGGALQIAIVLASVSVVTRVWLMARVAAVIGGLATLAGLGAAAGLI